MGELPRRRGGADIFYGMERSFVHLTDMAHIIRRPEWHVPDRLITPESIALNRRHFLRQMGFVGGGLLGLSLTGCSPSDVGAAALAQTNRAAGAAGPQGGVRAPKYPPKRHPDFDPKWRLSDEKVVARYNNFYEFTTQKDRVHRMVDKFIIEPWPVQIGGLVEKPMTLDAEELTDLFALEERVYRFRCVEAWSMIVPWSGFPLAKLIEKVQPKSEAKFVRFQTFNRPDQAPGMSNRSYPWPYTEGLRLDEAIHPLSMLVTGMYGKPLPKQNGAPIRLIVPWKYGYKSIKSIVSIDFVSEQPSTLWEALAPHEYPFESNVDPGVPHPRWSQATERLIDTNERVKTLPYNGYGDQVARLYGRG
jgi:methionine sulfoxide reductase catalytic subunit